MQIQLDHVGGGERVLRQVGEDEFIDDACTCDADRAFLLPGRMGSHDHPAGYPFWSHRYLRAIVETAHRLTFGTVLELIGRQVQTPLDQRMIECGVLFAASHKGEACEIREHGPGSVLAVEPEQRASRGEVVSGEIARD